MSAHSAERLRAAAECEAYLHPANTCPLRDPQLYTRLWQHLSIEGAKRSNAEDSESSEKIQSFPL